MTDTDKKYAELQEIGKSAMSAIAEMVAALECDYDRLEELKDERDSFEPSDPNDDPLYAGMSMAEQWAARFPDDAEELKALEEAAGDCEDREDAEQRIHEDPLSLEYRSGWVTNKEDMVAEEFKLLLTTGGPAVQIIGELESGEPCHVR
jgi:hypothetical protein